jgi:hypothetical protein
LNAAAQSGQSSSILSTSPEKYSPSKLPAFLQYAKNKLGVKNATRYEYSLANSGFGPDILPHVDNTEIIACGVSSVEQLIGGVVLRQNGLELNPRLQRLMPRTTIFGVLFNLRSGSLKVAVPLFSVLG